MEPLTGEKVYVRTEEDVKSIIKHAKLDSRKLTKITQALYYPPAPCENLRLLELDKHMLAQINAGQNLYFKGGLSEKVVLVTDERTYDVKAAEISNSLLLVPEVKLAAATSASPLRSPSNANTTHERSHDSSLEDDMECSVERVLEHCNVLSIFHDYIECREIKPRFRKLNDLLLLTRYSGPENEEAIDRKLLFTFNQMLDTIQCSRKEFVDGLRLVRAFEVDGFLRVLELEYEYRILHQMLALIDENSWPLDEIDKEETIRALEGIAPNQIIEAIFEIYAMPSVEKPTKYTYDVRLVARLVAQNILRPNLRFHLDEFMNTWQDALPEHMSVDISYIRGLGIIDREVAAPAVRSLPEHFLPVNVHDRMKVLFKTKRKWTLEEMEPFMECFSTPSQSVSTLLAKYARSLTENGVRYYVSKH